MPPFSRSERIEDYQKLCSPIEWQEQTIQSSDGTRLAFCVASTKDVAALVSKPVINVLYFQG